MRPRTYTVKFEIGCIACRKEGFGMVQAEEHHLLTTGLHGNGKRRGDDFTIGLCAYHHRGVPGSYAGIKGPSYTNQSRAFRERYGSDDELLAYQNRLIAEHKRRTSIYPPGFSEAGHALGDEP